jgi:cytidylate kinase
MTEQRPHRPDGIIVALDGPAGSGKSSTARALAARLGFRHLDSGAFYRALTLAALQAGIDPDAWERLTEADLDRLEVHGLPREKGYRLTVKGEDVSAAIRSDRVNAHVSRMAAVPAVRAWLMHALREAGERGGLVADGRDIGTVVFPRAELKAFLVCAPWERARRRLLERGEKEPTEDAVREEAERLQARDEIDSTRAVAPLLQAGDAVLLDTTGMDFEEQVESLARLARDRAGGG